MRLINVADIPDEDGRTPRQKNLEKTHNIPIGALVETDEGLRLWVVSHDRDCDGTPLYSLSFDKNWKPDMYGIHFKFHAGFRKDGGYPEGCLTTVK